MSVPEWVLPAFLGVCGVLVLVCALLSYLAHGPEAAQMEHDVYTVLLNSAVPLTEREIQSRLFTDRGRTLDPGTIRMLLGRLYDARVADCTGVSGDDGGVTWVWRITDEQRRPTRSE